MKLAKHYIPDEMPCCDVWRSIIREVQLDAMKEGMNRAAEIARHDFGNVMGEILIASEALTEKDLN